jgi:hypothetical protein
MTTTTFAEYAAQQEARNDIALAVLGHTLALCEALRNNYIKYSIRMHEGHVDRIGATRPEDLEYRNAALEKLKQGISPVDFVIETGRKYHKIIFVDGGGNRSCHAFVNKKTGEVYKSASWSAPAKGIRYDLRLISDREWLLENADWAGGYLYRK